MESTMAGAAGRRHHHRRKVEVAVDHKEEAPAVQKEKSGGSTNTNSNSSSHRLALSEEVAPEPNKNIKLLERKPTEDINQSAEAFINKFRHQLLLQRLESIENYEQMLRRGT